MFPHDPSLSCSIFVETSKSLLACNKQGKYNISETIILPKCTKALTVEPVVQCHAIVILHDLFSDMQN